jgi:predicted DNA-binding transcriptional regulator AlpA
MGTPTKQQNKIITPKQFAIDYGIAESTQAKLRMRGEIPFSKIGNKFVRYNRDDIEAWFEAHKVTA